MRSECNTSLSFPYPEDFSGDVSNPVFFECVPFGVLHKVCDGPSSTKLHNKLQGREDRWKQSHPRLSTHPSQNTQPRHLLPSTSGHTHDHGGRIRVRTGCFTESIFTQSRRLSMHLSGWQFSCVSSLPPSRRAFRWSLLPNYQKSVFQKFFLEMCCFSYNMIFNLFHDISY